MTCHARRFDQYLYNATWKVNFESLESHRWLLCTPGQRTSKILSPKPSYIRPLAKRQVNIIWGVSLPFGKQLPKTFCFASSHLPDAGSLMWNGFLFFWTMSLTLLFIEGCKLAKSTPTGKLAPIFEGNITKLYCEFHVQSGPSGGWSNPWSTTPNLNLLTERNQKRHRLTFQVDELIKIILVLPRYQSVLLI